MNPEYGSVAQPPGSCVERSGHGRRHAISSTRSLKRVQSVKKVTIYRYPRRVQDPDNMVDLRQDQ